MTREEAIKILKSMSDISTQGEAIDMAIEALSEPSSDLISRADAIKAMWKALYDYQDLTEKQFQEHEELDLKDWFEHRIFVQRIHEECMKAVNALPSADAIHSDGVFVPNMEIPKACDYCLFHDSGWSWCKAKDKYCGDGKCPLIAVRGERND